MGIISNNLMKKILIFLILFSLVSCRNSTIEDVEEYGQLRLDENTKCLTEIKEWNDYNGNGYEIIVFKIEKNDVINLTSTLKSKEYVYYNTLQSELPFKETELGKLLINSSGYYLIKKLENEERIIVVDFENNKLYYSYSVW
jgi:hypothetical protein